MNSVGLLVALSLIALLFTVSTANDQGTITIPCSRVDEFLQGAVDVPPGATVKVSAVTVSQLIARVGGPENFAALMRTREGRRAVKQAGAITDEEYEWCKQQVQSELLRRERERFARERLQRPTVESPGPTALVQGGAWYLMMPSEGDSNDVGMRVMAIMFHLDPARMRQAVYDEPILNLPVTDEWTRVAPFDTAQQCAGALEELTFQARARTLRVVERWRVQLTERQPTGEQLGALNTELNTALFSFVSARATQCVAATDPRLAAVPRGAGKPADVLAVISFTPGRPIYVQAQVNGRAEARLVLDTGADRTMIAPRVLRAVGLAPHTTGTVRGVTGQATADVYEVSSLEVGGARVGRLTVFASQGAEPQSDGLLGQDFLRQFTVIIDYGAGRVTLRPK